MGVGSLTTVEMLATWYVRKALVDSRPSPYCVRSVAPGSRVCFARMRRIVMTAAPSAPVVSTSKLCVR